MTRMLSIMAVVVAIALTVSIGVGTADAHGGESGGTSAHGGDRHSGAGRGWAFVGRGFQDRRGFLDGGLRYGGLYGGYYPLYDRYGACYLTVYGTTYCY
jgi:hypothetical protein